MRMIPPATILLMALLVTLTVGCSTPTRQPSPYEECMSQCSEGLRGCVRSCYRWNWSAKTVMDCIEKCNRISAECQQRCASLKGPPSPRAPGHYGQGGDAG